MNIIGIPLETHNNYFLLEAPNGLPSLSVDNVTSTFKIYKSPDLSIELLKKHHYILDITNKIITLKNGERTNQLWFSKIIKFSPSDTPDKNFKESETNPNIDWGSFGWFTEYARPPFLNTKIIEHIKQREIINAGITDIENDIILETACGNKIFVTLLNNTLNTELFETFELIYKSIQTVCKNSEEHTNFRFASFRHFR